MFHQTLYLQMASHYARLNPKLRNPNPQTLIPKSYRLNADKGNSNTHGARPVHQIISMIEWIRTIWLSMNNSLSRQMSSRLLVAGMFVEVASIESPASLLSFGTKFEVFPALTVHYLKKISSNFSSLSVFRCKVGHVTPQILQS